MSHYGRYDDDRKRNKQTRTEFKHTDKQATHQQQHHHRNGKHRDDKDDYEDYYYSTSSSSKRHLNSRSRSRSRSPSKSRLFSDRLTTSNSTTTNQIKSRNSLNTKYDESKAAPTTPASFSNNMITKAFNPGNPSRTIMLRQLPLAMDDHELRNEFSLMGIVVKDIRLVKNRDTGQSRGFAFIEFHTVEEAQSWMNTTLGWIVFSTYPNKVQMFYSNSGDENTYRSDKVATDWDCAKCGIKNFKRRDRCFKCGITREESEKRSGGEGYDHVGTTPCNTLLLRGLDALTNEATVIEVLNKFTNSCMHIKNCHIAKDVLTNVSCGFAFIELNSIQDATVLLQLLQPHIEVDGKQVTAAYSKNSFKTALTQLEISSRMAYQPLSSNDRTDSSYTNNKQNQTDQANSAASIAQQAMANMQKKQELLSHYTTHFKHQLAASQAGTLDTSADSSKIDSTVGANLQMLAKQADMLANKKYPVPDPTTFTYDETSGYYYDYTTGFYYDATSQYYYNPLTQQYMYYDPVKSTYVPAASSTSDASSSTASATTSASTAEAASSASGEQASAVQPTEQDKNLVKTAKQPAKTAAQIAKDMERWAQSQNKKKNEVVKKPIAQPVTIKPVVSSVNTPSSSTAVVAELKSKEENGGFVKKETELVVADDKKSFLKTTTITYENEKSESNDSLSSQKQARNETTITTTSPPPPPLPSTTTVKIESSATSTVATFNESSFVDAVKLACLLCKRRFDSLDILNKHVAKSDLHKKNLENYKKEHQHEATSKVVESTPNEESNKTNSTAESDSLLAALQYRDRAKERRQKYGTPEPPSPTYSSSSSSSAYNKTKREYDDSSNSGSFGETESVAAKMMKKMGWSEGGGIGKNLQGIAAPIEATMRQKGAGLGASAYEMDPNDSYREGVRKSARARFESLN